MAELGAISQYALSVQQMQMSVIKTQLDMQKQVIEILLGGNENRTVTPSATHGHNIDISV